MILETKFIEGTNNQYSIRNDGVIIRHYLKKGRGFNQNPYTVFEDVIINYRQHPTRNCLYVPINSNNRVFNFFKNALLAKYFNFIICPKCNNKIEVEKHERVCQECIRKQINSSQRKAKKNNPELYKSFYKKYYDNNKKTLNDKSIIQQKQNREEISKNYVATKLNISVKVLDESTYENYKALLLVKRLLASKFNLNVSKV